MKTEIRFKTGSREGLPICHESLADESCGDCVFKTSCQYGHASNKVHAEWATERGWTPPAQNSGELLSDKGPCVPDTFADGRPTGVTTGCSDCVRASDYNTTPAGMASNIALLLRAAVIVLSDLHARKIGGSPVEEAIEDIYTALENEP
jgi:hypothetical protein